MILVFKEDIPVPGKKAWADPNPEPRKNWNHIFYAITNWFCTSNDFRKEHECYIQSQDILIHMAGEHLRYLSPDFRSAASLIYKAYSLGTDLKTGEKKKSTPGIHVFRGKYLDYTTLPKPHYILKYGKKYSNLDTDLGTVFATGFSNQDVQAEMLNVPATTSNQAVVWINYLRDKMMEKEMKYNE